MSNIVKELTDINFEEETNIQGKPVVVDFWASWCMPCKMQSPIFHELADELIDKAIFAKVNVDECEKIAYSLNITSIPTILIFKDGKVVESNVGLTTKAKLSELLMALYLLIPTLCNTHRKTMLSKSSTLIVMTTLLSLRLHLSKGWEYLMEQ